jgi:hypothetical protein
MDRDFSTRYRFPRQAARDDSLDILFRPPLTAKALMDELM